MNNFRSDRGRGGDRRSFGRGRSGGGGGGGRREMFDAVCSNCGDDCKLPFRPTTDKPVFCSNCFEEKGGNDRRGSDRRSGGRDSRGRDSDRSSQGGFDGKEISKLTNNVEILNNKLDKIITLLSSGEKVVIPEPKEKKVAKKKTVKKEKKTTKAKKSSKKKEEKSK